MSEGVILHLLNWDKKFVGPFIAFMRKNFPRGRHQYLVYGDVPAEELKTLGEIVHSKSLLKEIALFSEHLCKSEKIILHGLFCMRLYHILAMHPWVLRKCYWVIWGGDLYVHVNHKGKGLAWKIDEVFRRFVISRIGNFVTYIEGDFNLARVWYGASGKFWECIMYPSNLFKPCYSAVVRSGPIRILVGNSADPSNNQQEIIEKLVSYKDRNIIVYAALSYGNLGHAAFISRFGKEKLGGKFTAMRDFMPLKEYLDFLLNIDIAIFNHNRQQAMGNTINLLGMGKKVFVRSDTTQWSFLVGMGLKLFDSKTLDLDAAINSDTSANPEIVAGYFSEANLRKQYEAIFA